MIKNGFLTFCFSFIPGAGQMYLGFQKRGLSLMCLAGLFAIFALELGALIFIVPFLIVMAYSFFDCHNLRDAIKRGESICDDYLFSPQYLKRFEGNRLVGIGVILIGVYLFMDKTVSTLLSTFDLGAFQGVFYAIRRCLPSLIASSLTIGIGIRMIRKQREE